MQDSFLLLLLLCRRSVNREEERRGCSCGFCLPLLADALTDGSSLNILDVFLLVEPFYAYRSGLWRITSSAAHNFSRAER
jgi:hypothetical protein